MYNIHNLDRQIYGAIPYRESRSDFNGRGRLGTSFMMALREHQGSHSQPIYIYKEASGEVQKKDPARLESDVVTGTLMLAPEQS